MSAPARDVASGLVVRAFRDADEPAVSALWVRVFGDAAPRNAPDRVIAQKRKVQPELFLVAELAGDLVGTAIAGDDGHRGWLHLLAVSPDHRKAGIGRRLVAESARLLRERGVPKLNLQVRGDNAGVVAFYERLGFAVEDRVSMGLLLETDA
jgi:ribosomal protein S18 acetylase RimI-like enzyme